MKPIKLTNRHVLAISGGVDSVTLLDLVIKGTLDKSNIIIAHVDHGIREDSYKDLDLVKELAQQYDLAFYYKVLELGPNVSEEKARNYRYNFLNNVLTQTKAKSLITAHHQDDLIETILINLIRGTNRKGLTSLSSNKKILRPLLNYSKQEIIDYARVNKLKWREDSTNKNTDYLRNYLRVKVLSNLSKSNRQSIVAINESQKNLNQKIDLILENIYNQNIKDNKLDRLWFSSFDFKIQKEILAHWLRRNGLLEFNAKQIERTVNSLKVAAPGAIIEVSKGYKFDVEKKLLALQVLER